MKNRWDYRSVEGALYDLGRPVDARPAQPRLTTTPRTSAPGPRGPGNEVFQRVDFAQSVKRSLDQQEIQDLTDHYILGVRRLGGREGYRRRETIIKKLLSSLNEESA